MPEALQFMPCCLSKDGEVVVAGGSKLLGAKSDAVYKYNPAIGTYQIYEMKRFSQTFTFMCWLTISVGKWLNIHDSLKMGHIEVHLSLVA